MRNTSAMSFYRRVLFPHLTHRFLAGPQLGYERQELLRSVHGVVLEVGFGSGLNLSHYPPTVTKLFGVDPSTEALRLTGPRINAAPFRVELVEGECERLPFEEGMFDAVVLTWTLCMLEQPKVALQEIRRVLRGGGRLYFLEHGRSVDPEVTKWQDRWNPYNRLLFAGCNINRPIVDLIAAGPFELSHVDTYYRPGPRIANYVYRGFATKQEQSG